MIVTKRILIHRKAVQHDQEHVQHDQEPGQKHSLQLYRALVS